MDGFKTWYKDQKGKYILFFGFYLIFFIFIAISVRTGANKPINNNPEPQEKVINTYDLSNLINNDYNYNIEINDDLEFTTFSGTKTNVDYANYTNKYFLDIYNINQLLKRSKLVNSEDNILTYELLNSEINDILLTNKEYGVNKIMVYVNDDTTVDKINIDLSSYLEKEYYTIMIDYNIGEENENSPS